MPFDFFFVSNKRITQNLYLEFMKCSGTVLRTWPKFWPDKLAWYNKRLIHGTLSRIICISQPKSYLLYLVACYFFLQTEVEMFQRVSFLFILISCIKVWKRVKSNFINVFRNGKDVEFCVERRKCNLDTFSHSLKICEKILSFFFPEYTSALCWSVSLLLCPKHLLGTLHERIILWILLDAQKSVTMVTFQKVCIKQSR